MKKLTFLKSTLAALSLAFLGACSTLQYTFTPGTGSYHESIAKKPAEQKAEPVALADASAEINASASQAEIITSPKAEAASALAQVLAANKKLQASETAVSTETKTDKKAARETVKQLKKDIKTLKKKIKEENASGINSNVKLLIILGLVFIVLGLILPFLAVIGLILLLIGLILLLMDIL